MVKGFFQVRQAGARRIPAVYRPDTSGFTATVMEKIRSRIGKRRPNFVSGAVAT